MFHFQEKETVTAMPKGNIYEYILAFAGVGGPFFGKL